MKRPLQGRAVASICGIVSARFGVVDEPVMLGMEDVVDSGQADILVGAAVARDEVGVEQLVVVLGATVARVIQADLDIAVGNWPTGTASWAMSARKAWPVRMAALAG